MKTTRYPELLVPAGSPELLKIAVHYGADAVYIGGEAFSLRAKAHNFTLEQMEEGIRYAHAHGVRVYVTANIFAHNEDLEGAADYFRSLGEIGPDALLLADPGMYDLAASCCPQIERHISTQANNVNYATCRFWHRMGAKRIVCGRELSLREIRQIRDRIPEEMELEAFVHGAMCMAYSGRCLLSHYLTGRDANRGACTHPCRWRYAVAEESRPGEYMPVEENERGTYIFSSRDLCMISHIPDLIDAGIDSLKIEGRMKTALYVAATTRAYRQAIDDCQKSRERYEQRKDWYEQQVRYCTYRPFSTGFFYGPPQACPADEDAPEYERGADYLGYVEEVTDEGDARITQRNKFTVGEMIRVIRPDGRDEDAAVEMIRDLKGQLRADAPHAKEPLYVRLSVPVSPYDMLTRPAVAADHTPQG